MSGIDYTPPPTVAKFIRDFTAGEFFQNWIIGPVGSGKTTGIFFKLAYLASLQEPSPVDGIRRTRAVIVRNTMPQLKDTTMVSWEYWFKDGVAGHWNLTDKIFTMRWGQASDGTGGVECEVLFRPLDTAADVARCLSLEVTFAIFDEFVEIDKDIIKAMKARCGRFPKKELYPDGERRGATNFGMWGSSNPGNEDQWWYEYLCIERPQDRPKNMRYYEQPGGFAEDAENLENLPGERKYYVSLSEGDDDPDGKKPDEAWVNRFINVQWGFSLAGKPVVPTFNLQFHVAKKPLKPNPHLPLIIGYDPGIGGSAMIFMQQDLEGRLLIFDELIQRGYGTERLVTDRLKPLLFAKYPDFEVIIAPDPAADSRTQNDEKTGVETLKRLAKNKHNPSAPPRWTVKFIDLNNQLQGRLDAIEHYTTRITSFGAALLVDPSCRGTIRALNGGWHYATDRKGKTADEPEKNEHSHTADATCYGARYCQKSVARAARSRGTVSQPTYVNSYAAR